MACATVARADQGEPNCNAPDECCDRQPTKGWQRDRDDHGSRDQPKATDPRHGNPRDVDVAFWTRHQSPPWKEHRPLASFSETRILPPSVRPCRRSPTLLPPSAATVCAAVVELGCRRTTHWRTRAPC